MNTTESITLANGSPLVAQVSWIERVTKSKKSHDITLEEYMRLVASDTYSMSVREIREAYDLGDEDLIKRLKNANLPAVTLSGVVTEGGTGKAFEEGRFAHNGLLQGDFDRKDLEGRDPADVKDALSRDPHVQCAFFSPSGGVKIVVRIPVCETPEQHRVAFGAARAYFFDKYGIKIDPSTKNAVRLCYVSHDPQAFVRPCPAEVLPVSYEKGTGGEPKAEKASHISAGTRAKETSCKHGKFGLAAIREMLSFIPSRPDYMTWMKVGSAVFHATDDEALGTELLNEWSPEEKTGEYGEMYKNRLTEVTTGTLVWMARGHGYGGGAKAGDEVDLHIPADVFPLPTGEIDYQRAGKIIFGAIAPSHRLFIRGGCVQEIVNHDDEPACFAPVPPERFCSLIEGGGHRVARREWQEGGGKGSFVWRSKRMPINTAKILLHSDAAARHLPRLRQLAACPILTKEGVMIGRGYHDHAGGTYITGGDIPPEMPLEGAVGALLGLLDDFNFVDPADKSRAVASFLSPALKMGNWIDDDFPLDVAEADQSQSGKTYRQKLVNRIYNEIPSAITAPRGGVGSLDETISGALIRGRPFITLDNFRGKVDSTILEQAIRGVGRVSCRAFRASADINTRPFMWQLSTNGAEFTRDIANRSIITRIRKQPPGYRFKECAEGSLEAHVAARQAFYLGAVFSVIKEWSRNGCPKTGDTRHDFRGWCQALDWIVQNIFGLAPLLDGHREEQGRTANPGMQWLRDVTNAVGRARQLGRALSTAELCRIAEGDGIEFPGVSYNRDQPQQRAGKLLGKIFRDAEGQQVVVDGLLVMRREQRIHVEGRGHELQKTYTIIPAPP